MLVLSVAFSAQPAFGHDPPVILPTRLDFDATSAPQECNDSLSFQSILGAWVDEDVLRADAARRLIVRIRSSSTGGKRADVSLVDAQGATLVERHWSYATTTECHKVLWAVAREAATILGAFEPPPPKEPVPCPACPACPSCPSARPYPAYILPVPRTPITTPNPIPYRSFLGLGVLVRSGIHSEIDAGPYLLLGFVPSRRLSYLHVEVEGAWTSQTLPSAVRVHAIPLVDSFCLVRDSVRFCGGLATTIFYSNQSSPNDELLLHLGANFRIGTELFARGPFAIRADVFARLAFAQTHPAPPAPFAAGTTVMGAWSID